MAVSPYALSDETSVMNPLVDDEVGYVPGSLTSSPDAWVSSEATAEIAEVADATGRVVSDDSIVCWRRSSLSDSDLLIGGGLAAVGAMCLGGAALVLLKGSVGSAIAFGGMGTLVLCGGAFLLLAPWLSGSLAIEATASGIEVVTSKASRQYAWHEIDKVVTLEFQCHSNANPKLIVTIEPLEGDAVRFETDYEGNPLGLLEVLETHCDYIVRNPRGFTRSTR
ncbi:MAG: hypothetical protein KDA61_13980 [Planctomycetales bacterium]|nr:hypothetical protein [Planctomycetales bacterium]